MPSKLRKPKKLTARKTFGEKRNQIYQKTKNLWLINIISIYISTIFNVFSNLKYFILGLFINKSLSFMMIGLLVFSSFANFSFYTPNINVQAAADPQVSLSVPDTLIGDTFDVVASFDNADSTDTGFGPYIDLIIPFNGTDGINGDTTSGSPTEADGIISVNSATYLGTPLTTIELVFPDDTGLGAGVQNTGCVDHPFAVDIAGVPLEVCGNTGDILVVTQLPFGSFVPNQPNADVTFNVTMSQLADINQPLEFQALGGFMFGNDEFVNPNSDPSIVASSYTSASTFPQVVIFEKEVILPEGESHTGPNNPFQYVLTATLAVGQTVDNFQFVDELPNTVVYQSLILADTTAGCTETSPVPPTTGTASGSILTIDCGTIGLGDNPVTATYEVYVSDVDGDGGSVIDHDSCDDTPTVNSATSVGDWNPIDPRDVGPTIDNSFVTPVETETVTNKCIQIQKSNSIDIDNGNAGYTPGDIIEYTLEFQISDFFILDDVDIQDIVNDGVHILEPGHPNFAPPTLAINSGVTTTSGPIDSANYSITNNWTGAVPVPPSPDGTTILDVDVSGELATRSLNTALFGGCVSPNPAQPIDCESASPTYNTGATTGTITYLAEIQDQYTDIAGDPSVDHADVITNNVTIEGEVIDNSDRATPTGSVEEDTSSSSFEIESGTFAKNILAINNADPSGITSLSPGDAVTYQLTYTLPSSDTENFMLEDYLPKPVFDVSTLDTFITPNGLGLEQATTTPFSMPPIGQIWLGPIDTFYGVSNIDPVITQDIIGNSFLIDYGTFDDPTNTSSIVDVVFTVEVSDAPFGDGLQLTNQALATEQNTSGSPVTSTQINQITLDEPELEITKGAIDSDSLIETYSPDPAYGGGVTFDPVGTSTACGHFSGTISSDVLDSDPIISDITDVDGSDLIRFATVIENVGSNGAYDIYVRDILPAGFSVPAGGDNLCVTRGDGTVLSTSNIGGGSGMFDQGIEIIDPTEGAADEFDAISGANVIIVTYDIQADDDMDLQADTFNHAAIFNYASRDNGTDFGGPGDGDIIFDDTDIFPTNVVEIDKSVVSTEEPSVDNSEVTIGSLVQYEIELTINEGLTNDVVINDNLGAGLALVSIDSITPSTDITTDVVGGFASVQSGVNVTGSGQNFELDLGNLTNLNDDNSIDETIVIAYTAVVLNDSSVSTGDSVNNTATVEWSNIDEDGVPEILSEVDDDNSIEVVEPNIEVNKNIVETSGDAGDTITIELTVDHSGSSTANGYNLTVSDTLPAGMTYAGGFTTVNGIAPTTSVESGGVITLTYDSLGLLENSTVSFTVTLDGTVTPLDVIQNDASLEYSSMSDDGSTPESPYNTDSIEQTYTNDGQDTLTIDSYSVEKTIVDTSINDGDVDGNEITTGNNVVVGEQIQYQVVVDIPEGTSPSVQLRDFLDDGLDLVSIDSITASPGVSTSIAGGFAGVASNVSVTNASLGRRRILLNFGEVQNTNSDAAVEQITILYTVIVENVTAISNGVARNNSVRWRWDTPVHQIIDSAPNVIVQEPNLVATKSSDIDNVNAGDTVEYEIEITNNGTSPALDVVVNDVVPGVFNYVALSANIVTAHTATTDDSGAPSLVFNIDQIDVNETVTITYEMIVTNTAVAGNTYTNDVDIEWTSLTGVSGDERTGDDTDPGGTENDYSTTTSDDVVMDGVVSSKSIIETSEPDTVTGVDSIERVVIGEVVRYRLVKEISESSLPNFEVVDYLPNGMQYLDDGTTTIALISNAGGTTNLTSDLIPVGGEVLGNSVITPTFVMPAGSIINDTNGGNPFANGDDVRFDLGNVINGDEDDGDTEYIVIELNAIVLNDITNQGGTNLENSFELFVDDGSGPNSLGTSPVDVNNTVTVVEPDISINKTITTVPNDAGDPVVYEIRVENGTGANISTAYDLNILDLLNSNLVLQSVSVSGPTNTDNSNILGNLVDVDIAELAPGEVVIVTVNAVVASGAQNGDTIGNEGTYTYDSISDDAQAATNPTDSSIPGGEGDDDGARNGQDGAGAGLNNYAGSSNVDLMIGVPEIEKISPSQTEYVIGEEVTYEILVTLPEGDTVDMNIVDGIPDGLDYVSHNIYELAADSANLTSDYNGTLAAPTVTGGSGTGDDISFDFGTTNTVDDNDPDNNSFVIEVTAQVVNQGSNQNGTALINSASIEWTNPETSATDSISDDADAITVAEPVLDIVKSVDDDTVQFGQTVEYTIDITHNSASTADAYDILVTDIISGDLDYVIGSSTLPAGWSIDELSNPTITFTGDLPNDGSTVQIRFEATAKAPGSYLKGTVIGNTADINWTSLDGAVTGERSGSGGVDDYTNSGSVDITITAPDLTVDINDSIGTTNPGDTNIYDVEIINIGNNQADNSTATITIPANATFDPGSSSAGWVCVPDNSSGSVCTNNVGTINPSGIVNIDFALTIDSVLPAGANDITVDVSVADDGANGPECISTNNTSSDTDVIDAAPDLGITKDDGVTTVAPGGQTTYTLTITNTGTQNATGVVVSDTLPTAGVSYNTSSDSGTESAGIVTWPSFNLNVGDTVIRSVTIDIDGPIDSGIATIENIANVTDDGSNGTDLNPANNSDNDIDDVDAAPDLDVSKSISSPVVVTNGSVVNYAIDYGNIGDQDATGVVLTESVPIGSTFDSGNALNTGWTCVANTEGSTCTFTIGDLDVGDSGSTNFVVIVDDPIDSEQENLDNTVSISDDGTNGLDGDPSNNSSMDSTPIDATPDLRTTKTDNQTVATAGQSITYIIEVFNDGNQDVVSAQLTDTLPTGVTFVSASGGGTEALGVITWPAYDLDAGTSKIFTVTVTLDNPVAAGMDSITNSATSSFAPNSGDTDPTNNNTAEDTDTINAAPDLVVTKTDNGLDLVPGSSFPYDINYTNVGTQDATGVVITDTIPTSTVFDPANSTPGWSCAPDNNPGSICTITIGNLDSGDSGSVVFAVIVDNPLGSGIDSTNNTVSIADDGANGPDENPSDNSYDEQTTVDALPELYLQKDDGGITVEAGDPIVYTLTYGNSGNQTSTGNVLTETVPIGTTIDLSAPENAGWSCTGTTAGSTCTYLVGVINSNEEFNTTFAVIVDNPVASGINSIENSARIDDDGANGTETNTVNNDDGASTELNAAPDLNIVKDDGLTNINPGDSYTYTLTITNIGSQDATGVQITDILPPELTYVGSSDSGSESGGTVTWPVVDVAVGDIIVRTVDVLFDVPVNQVPAGLETLTNTATAFDDGANGPDLDGSNNIAEDIDDVNGDVDLTVTIDDGNTTVSTGDSVVYKVTIDNLGSQFASNTMATITIPAGVSFDSGTSTPGWTCTPDGNAGSICTINVGTVTTIAETCVFFGVIVDDPSNVDEIDISVDVNDDGTSGPELDDTNNDDNDVDNIIGNPNLTVTKTDNQNIAEPGETLIYEVEVTNNGDIILTGIEVIDTLPQYTTFVSSDNGGVFDSGLGQVNWSVLSLIPNESIILTVEVVVDDTVPSGVEDITNNVSGTEDGTHGVETDTSDNEFEDIDTLEAQPELDVVIEATQDLAYPGEEVEFLITHTNLGNQDATGVEVTFTIPENTTGQPTAPGVGALEGGVAPLGLNVGWVCPDLNPGTTCTYLIGNVAADEDCIIPFFVIVDEDVAPGDTIIGETTVYDDGLNGAEITLVNNDSNDNVIIPFTDLQVTKTTSSNQPQFGDDIVYTISYLNNGPDDATDVVIRDILPSELAYVFSTNNGALIDPIITNNPDGTTTLDFSIGDLANGEVGEIQLITTLNINVGQEITNNVEISGREAEITNVNNQSLAPITTIENPGLTIDGLIRTGKKGSKMRMGMILITLGLMMGFSIEKLNKKS